mmetsp:Transcript_5957/g.14791  ORF Transcript_5957/g.14791 Transcript_5957/m.14791 type:complete len:210 (+) Transcript_5957:159-788(+)
MRRRGGRRSDWRQDGPRHPAPRHHRGAELQPQRRGDREGAPCPGDRRPGRPDREGRGRRGDPLPRPQPTEGTGRPRTASANGPGSVQGEHAKDTEGVPESGSRRGERPGSASGRTLGPDRSLRRCRQGPDPGGRYGTRWCDRGADLPRRRDHDRNLSSRSPHARSRAVQRGTAPAGFGRSRTALGGPRENPRPLRLRAEPAQDGDARAH